MSSIEESALPPEEGIRRLLEGNRRFLEQRAVEGARVFRPELAEQGQRPFAVVLGCSDSRTPVEILFDQGFGDLFVVRLAGHVVAPSVVGSIEFAVEQFGTRLVVVMGHTRCGAIAASVKALRSGDDPESRNLRAITDRIAPNLRGYLRAASGRPEEEVLRESMRLNVQASCDNLRHASRLLEDLVSAGRVQVVGAEYELETGRVNLLDGVG